jgi:hypothetical protein
MAGKWLEIAQKMAESARAGVAIEKKRLAEILAQRQPTQAHQKDRSPTIVSS